MMDNQGNLHRRHQRPLDPFTVPYVGANVDCPSPSESHGNWIFFWVSRTFPKTKVLAVAPAWILAKNVAEKFGF